MRANVISIIQDEASLSQTQSKRKNIKRNFTENLKNVTPLTDAQNTAFEKWDSGNHLILDGSAGTGKTYLSLAMAFEEVMDKSTPIEKVVIFRSAVPSRDIGFMPGDHKEKTDLYSKPYRNIVHELFKDPNAWDYLEQSGNLMFESTSFIRGITLDNTVIIADEMQNMNFAELNTIMTRVGKNTRMIFSGDYHQSDFTAFKQCEEKQGILKFLKILDSMDSFEHVNFTWEDIVRSDIVKEYIIAKEKLERNL